MNDKFEKFLVVSFTFFVLVTLINKCVPDPQPENPKLPAIKAGQKEANWQDSITTATEQARRAVIDSVTRAQKGRQEQVKIVYKYIKATDEQLEQAYREGKADADTVISSKNRRIGIAENMLARCDSLRATASLNIDSYKREIEGKNAAITMLNANLDLAVEELSKPEPKPRMQLLTVVAGPGLTYVPSGQIYGGLQVTAGLNVIEVINRLKK